MQLTKGHKQRALIYNWTPEEQSMREFFNFMVRNKLFGNDVNSYPNFKIREYMDKHGKYIYHTPSVRYKEIH